MAARKSCTHLTWADAKSADNPGGDARKKKGGKPKKLNHLEKVIAKHGATQEAQLTKSDLRKHKRAEERGSALTEKRAEERQQQRQLKVKPHEQAQERMAELALKQAASEETAKNDSLLINTNDMDLSDLKAIAQCKELQLDEILALEAIFVDTNEFSVSESSKLDELREKIEEYQMDEENEDLLRSVVQHPPIILLLQQTINCNNEKIESMELVASVLLLVTLPPTYPLSGSTPHFNVIYFMVTDKHIECSADKPLESLAHLEETELLDALWTEAKQILPDPCVYEVGCAFLSENLFDMIVLSSAHHATQTKTNE
jgi:hypothetical protein